MRWDYVNMYTEEYMKDVKFSYSSDLLVSYLQSITRMKKLGVGRIEPLQMWASHC